MALSAQVCPLGFSALLALAPILFRWVPLQRPHQPLPLDLAQAPLQKDTACVPSLLLGRTLLRGTHCSQEVPVQGEGGHIRFGNLPRECLHPNPRDPILCPSRAPHFCLLPFLNLGGMRAGPQAMGTGIIPRPGHVAFSLPSGRLPCDGLQDSLACV